jgi:hypothetical protein
MDVFHSSGRILDGDHQYLLSRHVTEILLHDRDHNGLRGFSVRRLCELCAACENNRYPKYPKV